MISLFARKVLTVITRHNLLEKREKVVVGVSGGADSLCLLFVLREIGEIYNGKLIVAHLNHQIRGRAADEDEKLVRDTANKLNLPVEIKKMNIKEIARQNRLNLEDAARQYRRDFLSSVAKKHDCEKIALGHNVSDFTETVLMKFILGSADFGLKGILWKRDLTDKIKIIRPLLGISRDEIERYCKMKKIKWRTDITNQDTAFLRNRVRKIILPQIQKINKNFNYIMLKTSEIYQEENNCLDEITNQASSLLCKRRQETVHLDLKKFSKYNIAIKRRLIKKTLEEIQEGPLRLTFENIEDVLSLENKAGGKMVHLRQNIIVKKNKDKIIFYKKEKN